MNKKEQAGETVKEYIAKVRAWKSEHGIALNAPISAIATYASEEIIRKLSAHRSIIFSTLRYPENHSFISGKPEIQETITSVEPVFAKLGPAFKAESSRIVEWIKNHQDELIQRMERKEDIFASDIPGVTAMSNQGLLQAGYLIVTREPSLKGKKGSTIISFDDFYIELERKKP